MPSHCCWCLRSSHTDLSGLFAKSKKMQAGKVTLGFSLFFLSPRDLLEIAQNHSCVFSPACFVLFIYFYSWQRSVFREQHRHHQVSVCEVHRRGDHMLQVRNRPPRAQRRVLPFSYAQTQLSSVWSHHPNVFLMQSEMQKLLQTSFFKLLFV